MISNKRLEPIVKDVVYLDIAESQMDGNFWVGNDVGGWMIWCECVQFLEELDAFVNVVEKVCVHMDRLSPVLFDASHLGLIDVCHRGRPLVGFPWSKPSTQTSMRLVIRYGSRRTRTLDWASWPRRAPRGGQLE